MADIQPIQPVAQSGNKPVLNLPTVEAYNLWAKTYDNDGNVLQKVDDIIYDQLLKEVPHGCRIMDLGCGTGRNTVKLLPFASHLVAVDNSDAMMEVAKSRVEGVDVSPKPSVDWVNYNINDEEPEALVSKLGEHASMDVVSSTLVLEHIKLAPFFSTVRSVLKPSGLFVLTNMHSEMGSVSQAGFNDPDKGVKIRPVSYNHFTNDIVEHAKKEGFRLQGEVIETGVRDVAHAEELGARAQKWVGIKLHVAIVFRLAPS